MLQIDKKSDKAFYNNSSEDFIPIACHYDSYTLLTKNGQLLQSFQINGINSEQISKTLSNLRSAVREAIKANVESDKLSFWIHTIRRKANLDDTAAYINPLSTKLHDAWVKKNFWHDKFVNCLYITVVYDAPKLELKNFSAFVNSLSPSIIGDFEFNYFSKAIVILTGIVDTLVKSLSEFGTEKLGIRIEGDACYSDLMFLYRRIIQLQEEECPLPTSDLSIALASHRYAVGNDMIEVIGENGKKFAALLSVKEYQEVSSESIDKFLQIPVEMVATEVFHFVRNEDVLPLFEEQAYIADIGGDKELKSLNGLDKILQAGQADAKTKFCCQQISFMIIAEDAAILNDKLQQASNTLAQIGVVHVREDINLEKVFWSQLPANFSFLSRMSPTTLDNVAATASLHNFPTGSQYNPWGKFITILRTEKGTPYFMNFHDENDNGAVAIFGATKSGRTTMLNFLLSEADKFNPTIVQCVDNEASKIYVTAKGGKWLNTKAPLLNPFMVDNNQENQQFCTEFLKIIANHYFSPLNDQELLLVESIALEILKLPVNERKLSEVIGKLNDSEPEINIKRRLSDYMVGGLYHGIFEANENSLIKAKSTLAIDLGEFDDFMYYEKNYPKEKKLVEEYEYQLNIMRSVKAGIVFAIQQFLLISSEEKKIFAIDDLSKILPLEYYGSLVSMIANNLQKRGAVFICSLKLATVEELLKAGADFKWLGLFGTKLVMPPEMKLSNSLDLLKFDNIERKKLLELNISSRKFFAKQNNKTIALELSLGNFTGILKILSAGENELRLFNELIKRHGEENTDKWVGELHELLENY